MLNARAKSAGAGPARQCAVTCTAMTGALCAVFLLITAFTEQDDVILEYKTFGAVKNEHLHREWLDVLHNGTISHVNFFHKGLARKFQVVFESGHIAAAKPIEPDYLFSAATYPSVEYDSLTSREKSSVRRMEWEYQGFSEIAAYHVDKVLQFNKKPPIVGRLIDNKKLFETDPSWGAKFRRLFGTYSAKMALVPWVDDLKRAIPSTSVRDTLTMHVEHPPSLPSNPVERSFVGDVSDKLVFDFLIDDHDTQGIQNWKADITSQLLHWDSGLGWRDGPYSHSRCLDILCGTKEWKGIGHYDPNPKTCNRICKFRKSTIKRMEKLYNDGEAHPRSKHIGAKVRAAIEEDPLAPVFNLGIFGYKRDKRLGERQVHLDPQSFYKGLQRRLVMLLDHVEGCIEEHGRDRVLVDM